MTSVTQGLEKSEGDWLTRENQTEYRSLHARQSLSEAQDFGISGAARDKGRFPDS